jgi:ribosomal protein S18 acetylase RimI-like enzyme
VTVRLRELTVEDWPLWRRLRLAALAEAPYAFGATLAQWQGDDDREQRWRDRLAVAYNLVALVGDEPVGMVSGMPAGDGVVELISMWVAPAARGRGVGELLVGGVLSWAAGYGAHTVRLSVFEGNTAAEGLYRRTGFRPTGEVIEQATGDRVRREVVLARPVPSR